MLNVLTTNKAQTNTKTNKKVNKKEQKNVCNENAVNMGMIKILFLFPV